jgi:hypothetical protein
LAPEPVAGSGDRELARSRARPAVYIVTTPTSSGHHSAWAAETAAALSGDGAAISKPSQRTDLRVPLRDALSGVETPPAVFEGQAA